MNDSNFDSLMKYFDSRGKESMSTLLNYNFSLNVNYFYD